MKKISGIIAILSLIAGNLYAGSGDFTVEGNVGIGTTTPSAKLEAVSTDTSTIKTSTTRSLSNTNITPYSINFTDSLANGSTGWSALSVIATHEGSLTSGGQGFGGAWYQVILKGSSSNYGDVRAQTNNIFLRVPAGKSYSNLVSVIGNLSAVSDSFAFQGSINTQKLVNYYASTTFENGAGILNATDLVHFWASDFGASYGGTAVTATNAIGLRIDKQSGSKTNYSVTNPMGIWLNGDGAGADLVLGVNRETKLYGNAGNFVIDTAGKVGIGTTTPNVKADINGDIALRAGAVTMANGNNNNIIIGSKSFIRITGPTSSFTITGIAGGFDGKMVILYNTTTRNMKISNEDTNSTDINRIYVLDGSSVDTNGAGAVTLIYDSASGVSGRWIVTSFQP
ncbi:MAG: hypothetical protein HY758_10425 [Nitrospirae bacterium]|nr:hypothetical protein [Nitrospirota bacterium]